MRIAAALITLLLACQPVWAQDTVATDPLPTQVIDQPPAEALPEVFADMPDFQMFTSRVEAAIAIVPASNSILVHFRSTLAGWRTTFLSRQGINASRIATVDAQIAALGPVPEDGNVDPRVTARREELNTQLNTLRAPAILAAEAYMQADGLIGEIDTLFRGGQAEKFIERTQSPLNPKGWLPAASGVMDALTSLRNEIRGSVNSIRLREELVQKLPMILALLAVAVVFLIRGRAWFTRVAIMIEARTTRGRGVVRFVLSLGQVIIPFVGLLAFSNALILSGMTGRKLELVLGQLPTLGLFAILAHWLAGQLLPKGELGDQHPLGLSEGKTSRAHRRFVALGYALLIYTIMRMVLEVNSTDETARSTVMFAFGVLIAWPLYRFGHVLRNASRAAEGDAPKSFRQSLGNLFSQGLMIVTVSGVGLAALGYANAVDVLLLPAAQTIYVFGVVLLLQNLSVDTYTLFAKSENAAQTALAPVLIAFLLILISLPVLAVIWGAQVTDLTELWARFREGFTIGETKISPSNFLLFAAVFAVGFAVTRLTQSALRSTVLPRTRMDAGGQTAVVSGIGYVGIFLAAVIAITTAGIDLSGLAIVAGALSVGIGFGLQNIVSNFISGIILLIERPISQGDWIEVGGQMGYVRDISVRSTRIETFDRTDVIVPNADLISGTVTNYTRGNSVGRALIPVGVAYGTDTKLVTDILKEIAEAHPMVLMNPGPNVLFIGFGADSLDFEIRAILRDVNYVMHTKSEINHEIAKRFAEAGIEIPFGQRDIWLRNPEVLDFANKRAARTPKPPQEDQ